MSKFRIILLFTFLIAENIFGQINIVKTGIEVLKQNNFDILKDKNIGLVTNPTGVDKNLTSTIDILYKSENVNLVALYGPEHGVRGDFQAGEHVSTYKDSSTNLPVYSLYGNTRKPKKKMLENINMLVYDIQDIGCRSYTYISTMGAVMEAAAENNIEVVILDRPNPLGGNRIEGSLVEDGFISFVSRFKIPYVYGLTCGELAQMINEEGLLTNGVKCNLKIVPMIGWKRSMTFADTKLEWVPASPHIPTEDSPFYYASTGILGELYVISIGVGYTLPFKTIAAPWINPYELCTKMNELHLPGIIFRPISYKPFYSLYKGKECHGVQLHITDFSIVNLTEIQFYFMQVYSSLYPGKDIFKLTKSNRLPMFDKVTGTDHIRKSFIVNHNADSLSLFWNKDVENFRKLSKKYYLYN